MAIWWVRVGSLWSLLTPPPGEKLEGGINLWGYLLSKTALFGA